MNKEPLTRKTTQGPQNTTEKTKWDQMISKNKRNLKLNFMIQRTKSWIILKNIDKMKKMYFQPKCSLRPLSSPGHRYWRFLRLKKWSHLCQFLITSRKMTKLNNGRSKSMNKEGKKLVVWKRNLRNWSFQSLLISKSPSEIPKCLRNPIYWSSTTFLSSNNDPSVILHFTDVRLLTFRLFLKNK